MKQLVYLCLNIDDQVLHDNINIFPDIDLKVKDGKTPLKKIQVGEMFREAGKTIQTLELKVFDADKLNLGQTRSFQYGSFYLRQVSKWAEGRVYTRAVSISR